MRILYYAEIIHGKGDIGSLGNKIDEASQKIMGTLKTVRLQKEIEKFWINLEEEIERLKFDYKKLVVFQDGLPDTNPQLVQKIVEEAAGKGSPNYLLLMKLKNKGAAITGTENPKLLMEEYKMAQEEFSERHPWRQRELLVAHRRKKAELLIERDKFIAKKIDQNLTEGAIGLAFMGMWHNVIKELPPNIQIKPIKLIPLEVRSLFEKMY